MRRGHFALAAIALIVLAACSTAHIDRVASADAERLYVELYPYYAEVCAVSELKKKAGLGVEISSGMGGHSILYLNGVCRDRRAGYPTIGLCDAETPAIDRGVGLSVNAHFKNANWVATQGRNFVFHGTLKPGERLTRVDYERTLAQAKDMGIYDGVEFHSEVFDGKPPGMSPRDYMYEVSVSTDYAIGFGRDRYCARVPLDREKMAGIVAFLNRLNEPYRSGDKDFDWNVLNNNCSHVTHNALATAGVWDVWAAERFILLAAFDFPVPKNEFVNLMRRTNDMPIDDPVSVFGDRAAREALLQKGWLPTGPGALAEAEPAAQANDIYDTDLRLIFYDDPILGSYRRHFAEIFSDPRYTDLESNLRHFAGLYRKIEQERLPLAALLTARGAPGASQRDELARFYEQYYRYVEREAGRVEAGLAAAARGPAASAASAGKRESGHAAVPASPRGAAPAGVPQS